MECVAIQMLRYTVELQMGFNSTTAQTSLQTELSKLPDQDTGDMSNKTVQQSQPSDNWGPFGSLSDEELLNITKANLLAIRQTKAEMEKEEAATWTGRHRVKTDFVSQQWYADLLCS